MPSIVFSVAMFSQMAVHTHASTHMKDGRSKVGGLLLAEHNLHFGLNFRGLREVYTEPSWDARVRWKGE